MAPMPPNAAADSCAAAGSGPPAGARTTRMLLGKLEVVGVDGSTLTDECGLRPAAAALLLVAETEGEAIEADADEVEDALEAEWRCSWMLRMEETEEVVDLRPRRPEERRNEECGVSGEGESEVRFWTEPAEEVVETRGLCCDAGNVDLA